MLKSYDELLKEKEYQDIANILNKNIDCRKDNRKLFKTYYKEVYGISVDEALDRNDVTNYQTIERKARKLKEVNHNLRYEKLDEVSKYKKIALEVPIAVRLF